MSYYVDPDIKNTVRVFPEQGRYDYYRYDMNENPEGLPQDFVDSVKELITPEFLAIYPEPDKFLNKYASFVDHGITKANLTATNGSDTAIRYILQTFGEKGKKVVTVSPSFEMYWVNCNILGLKHFPVPYNDDLTIDVNNILSAIDDDTRIVVLLNPNNPVGNAYSEEEVVKVIEKAQKHHAVVVIDEAYHYFYNKTFLPLLSKYDNIIILRTFSKLMSLAACRLGVIISHPDIIKYINNAKLTFDVNSIALLFGEKILERPELIDELIKTEQAGKDYTIKSLESHGYWCRDCLGNFILIKPKHNSHDLTKKLAEDKKILIHDYKSGILENLIRVSVGSEAAMKFFLDAFYEIDEA